MTKETKRLRMSESASSIYISDYENLIEVTKDQLPTLIEWLQCFQSNIKLKSQKQQFAEMRKACE